MLMSGSEPERLARMAVSFHPSKAFDPKSQLPSLTSFRGVAALWVVLYHYIVVYFSQLNPSQYTHFAEKGYLAVDLFFMLSGFVLTHVYRRAFSEGIAKHYKHFLLSRIARLYPLHIMVLLLFVATAVTSRLLEYAATGTYETIPMQGPRSWAAFLANLFMLQGLQAGQLSWNYPAWSISVEFAAYLLFPFLLPTIWRASPTCKIALAAFLIGILSLFSYYYGGNFNEWDGPQTLLRCLPEFALGTLLYAAFRSGVYVPILGSDAVSILIFLTTLSVLHFGGPDLAVVLLFAVLVLSVVVNTGNGFRHCQSQTTDLARRHFVFIVSAAGFFQFAIAQLLIAFGVQKGADLSIKTSLYLLIVMVAACLVSATAAYYGVEIVWRRYLKELFGLRGRLYGVRSAAPEPAGSN
jgi:peptidoglycan/LPS O-acetylase OafA/YrhL